MSDETPVKKFDVLEEKTVQTIDYIIRGLELGKFDETSKKVEFLGKLAGEEAPKYIAQLLKRISQLEIANFASDSLISTLQMDVANISMEKATLEGRVSTMETEMTTVAKAIQYLMKPDPLGSDYELNTIESFISSKGARKF